MWKFAISLVLLVCLIEAETAQVLLGGWAEASENEKGVQTAIPHAMKYINGHINSANNYRMSKLISVKKKVVSGILYRFVVEAQSTKCRKNDVQNNDVNNCEFEYAIPLETCTVVVLSQVWINPVPQLKEITCQTKVKSEKNLEMLKFQDFSKKYNKNYADETEYNKRFEIFKQNLKVIKLLNDNEQGTAHYGVTAFADLTSKEFSQRHLGLRPGLKKAETTHTLESVSQVDPLPDAFDWRDHNAVSEVKNQGTCGSCWAFSTTGNIEGQWALKKGQLLSLSEQELVDCDKLDEGCNGGLPSNAYEQIISLGGLEGEKDYPYDGKDDTCTFKKSLVKAYINGSITLPANETAMAAWLVQNGPISIGINANAMQFYFGGISHPLKFLCNPKNLDHGVLIVGYGVHTYPIFQVKIPFWIVKNSWGSSWGEQGYYRVYRGDGTCGLDQMATSATIA